jgi:hypothetical protein
MILCEHVSRLLTFQQLSFKMLVIKCLFVFFILTLGKCAEIVGILYSCNRMM